MDKIDTIASLNHNITINERKNIIISGVKKIESFDNEEFLLETTMGMLLLKGSGLEILKLDTHDGNVRIKGKITSYQYVDNVKGKASKEESFMAKLFK